MADSSQADNDNHANQCNPNNDEYWNSRNSGDSRSDGESDSDDGE